MVEIGRAAAHATRKIAHTTADQNLSRVPACKGRAPDPEIGSGRVRIDRFQTLIVGYRFVVAANSERVREARREDMSFLYRRELPRCQCVELNIIQPVGSRVGCPVVHVRAEQTILVGKLVVDTSGKKIFVDHLLACEREHSKVAVASYEGVLRCRVEGEVRLCGWVHRHVKRSTEIVWVVGIRAQSSGPCDDGGYGCKRRDALVRPVCFVVGEKECSILHDRPADRSPKLVALVGWDGLSGIIEKISGVQRTIPHELVSTAVNLICSRPRNGVDYAAGRLPIFG